ncbi:hypothetical protein FKP32DRAFT_65147 [Trametes sanguinea]|nr:hypothetical protein FKP32DRAFT_65147 [Trametes sanguinea]
MRTSEHFRSVCVVLLGLGSVRPLLSPCPSLPCSRIALWTLASSPPLITISAYHHPTYSSRPPNHPSLTSRPLSLVLGPPLSLSTSLSLSLFPVYIISHTAHIAHIVEPPHLTTNPDILFSPISLLSSSGLTVCLLTSVSPRVGLSARILLCRVSSVHLLI